jgi:hypothetical protein
MIEPIMKVKLTDNQYSSLCYLANHNEKEENYITTTDEAFSRFNFFLTKKDMLESIENRVNYVLFTKG